MFHKEIVINTPRVSYYVGGGEKIPMKQAQELAGLGHRVHLITQKVTDNHQSPLYVDFKNEAKRDIIFHEVPLERHGAPHLTDPETDPSIWNSESLAFASASAVLIKQINPDVVLSYYLLDGLFRVHRGANLVYLLGTPPEPLQLGVPMLRMYDADISISSVVQKHWQQYVNGEHPRFLLPSGVELPKESDLAVKEPASQVLFAGRLIERKGVDTLLHAFKKVSRDNSDARLIIAGDGPMRTELEKLSGELQIQGRVQFTGLVNSRRLQELINMSDVCVFPSYEGEGLLGVVLESMASAKAVIATTNNGNEDVISSMENGVLVEPRDVENLATNMNTLLSYPELAQKMGRAARQFIKNNLTWDQHAKRLLTIIDQVNK